MGAIMIGMKRTASLVVIRWLHAGTMDGLGGAGTRKAGDTDLMAMDMAKRLAASRAIEILGNPADVLQRLGEVVEDVNLHAS